MGKVKGSKELSTGIKDRNDSGGLPALSRGKREVAYWLSLGTHPRVIAAKTGLTLTYVNRLIKLPEVQELAEVIRSGELDELAEVVATRQIIERAAPRAAEKTVELMETADKDETQLRAAEGILDRAGHPRKQEVTRKAMIIIDPEAARLIEETRRMISGPIQEAEFELVEESNGRDEKDRN